MFSTLPSGCKVYYIFFFLDLLLSQFRFIFYDSEAFNNCVRLQSEGFVAVTVTDHKSSLDVTYILSLKILFRFRPVTITKTSF